MTKIRHPSETAVLSAEAERRVRAGESRAAVARSLDLPISTLRNWVLKGGCGSQRGR